MSDLTMEQLICEREAMETQMKKLEESAVQVIMEKEKIIQDLVEKLDQLMSNQSGLDIEGKILLSQEQLNQQITEKENEIQQLRSTVHELHSKLESEQFILEERVSRVEQETTDRLLDQFTHQMNDAKDLEQTLIHRLSESDEKLKSLERLIQDQEIQMRAQNEKQERELHEMELRVQDGQLKLRAALQKILKSDKTVEDVYKQMSLIKQERVNELLKVTKVKDEVLRNNIKLEKDVRRLQEQIQNAHQINEQLEKEIKHLKDKIWIDSKLSQEKLIEQERKFQFAKSQLQSEIQSLKLNESVGDTPFEKRRDSVSSSGNSFIREEHDTHQEGKQQGQGGANLLSELAEGDFEGFSTDNPFSFSSQNPGSQENIPQDGLPKERIELLSHSKLSKQPPENLFLSPKRQYAPKIVMQTPEITKITVNEMEDLREENDTLRDLIMSLKRESEEYKQLAQTYENTIEVLQNEIKTAFRTNGHEMCYQMEKKLESDLEAFKAHSMKIETHFMTLKQNWAEEQNNNRQELKYIETCLMESKTLMAQTTIEKEYFQSKYRQLQQQMKKENAEKEKLVAKLVKQIEEATDISQGQEKKKKGLLSSLFR